MGHYIVGTLEGPSDPRKASEREEKFYTPVRAKNPEAAVSKRGVIPENYLKVYVYPIKETPTGGAQVHKLKDD